MNKLSLPKIALFLLLFAGFSLGHVTAQDLDATGAKLNEANQAFKDGNNQAALGLYQQVIDMAAKLGEPGADLLKAAQANIPVIHFNIAKQLFTETKYDESVAEFRKAVETGGKFGDESNMKKAKEQIPVVYYSKGNALFKSKDFAGSLTAHSEAVKEEPSYYKAYYGMGLAQKGLDKMDEMIASMDKAIELGTAAKDDKFVGTVKNTAKKYTQAAGAENLAEKKYDNAQKYFDASLKYGEPDAMMYYQYALLYNAKKLWDKAIESTNSGLGLEKDTPEDKAKHYYEQGNAYKGKGDTAKACAAYKSAKFGKFVQNADYEIKTLKCN